MKHLPLILLVSASPAFAQTTQEDEDKGFLVNLIEDNLSGDTRTVSIVGFEGALSSNATIQQLTVADTDGVWLTLQDVALVWNRRALLRGAIDVTELTAGQIIIARAPLSDPSLPAAEATPFALPELPVSISLERLAIDRIELGDSFIGEPLVLSIGGSASLIDGQGFADVDALRLDGPEGRFIFDGEYNNITKVLGIDLDLTEGPSGIAARLLDLPDQPSVSLQVEGVAPLDDYAATLALSTNGTPRLNGDFALQAGDAGQTFALNLGGDVSPLFAPDYQEFLGTDIDLKVSGLARVEGGLDLNELALSAQSLNLNGALNIDADGWPTDIALTGTVASRSGELVLLPLTGPETVVRNVTFDLAFDDTLSDAISFDLGISEFARPGTFVENLALQGNGIIRKESSDVSASFTYSASGLEVDNPDVATALGTVISGNLSVATAKDQPIVLAPFVLRGAGVEMSADATIQGSDDGFETQANVLANIEALDRFSALSGLDLTGGLNATLISTIRPLDGIFDVIVNGETNDIATGIAQLDAVLAGQGTLSTQLVRDTDGTRLEAFRIATPEATITANADLRSTGSSTDFVAKLNDLNVVEGSLSGPAIITANATQDAGGFVRFDVIADVPDTNLKASGTVNPTTTAPLLRMNTQLFANDLTRYAPLTGTELAGTANITADVEFQAASEFLRVDLSGATGDLGIGIEQVDALLRGDGRISALVERDGDNIRVSDLSAVTQAIDLSGNVDLKSQGIDGDVNAQFSDLSLIEPRLSGPAMIIATANQNAEGLVQFDVTADAPDTALTAVGNINLNDDAPLLALTATLDAQNLSRYAAIAGTNISGGANVSVTGDFELPTSRIRADISGTTQNLAIGSAQADSILRGTGRITGRVERNGGRISVTGLNANTPALSLSADLQANGDAGQATFNARLADIGLITDQLSGPVTATGNASRSTGLWNIDIDASGPGGIGASADGAYADSGQINMRVNGSAPLGIANDILEPRRLSGLANFDLAINGPADVSSISGQITTSGARLAIPSASQALEDINAAITLRNGAAQVAINSNVQAGGTLEINGPVNLSSPFQADITARLGNIIVRDPNLYQTSLRGQIRLSGPLAGGASVKGNIALGPTDISVPSSGIGALGTLPTVTHIGATNAVRQTLNRAGVGSEASNNEQSSSGPAYPLDIDVTASSRIFIRGRGLDAEMAGSLNIGGTSNDVLPIGTFELVRGRLDILQQRFQLTEGTASLQGDFEPYIRLVARTEASTGTVIEIIVEGPASEPEVTFQSSPELPQDEVLSQLIFGRNLSEISPLQAVQLAAAVGTLAGRGGGGLVDGFREGLGLDDFDVTTDEEGNAAVRAGAYLSKNIYTDVTVSSDGSTEINLNLDITDEITAKGTVDADGETSIGIFFERDY